MVFVSISPFVFRKIGLLVLGLICLSSLSCLAGSIYLPVASTPYDRQMSRIRPILASKAVSGRDNLSLGVVNQWIGDLREIPYGYSMEWKTPDEVYHGPVADCKGKAVALYERMQAKGAQGVRLVIGRRTSMSRKTHAWVEWNTENGTYILDPTINWSAYSSAKIGNSSYLPLYAYSGAKKFRSTSATLLAQN